MEIVTPWTKSTLGQHADLLTGYAFNSESYSSKPDAIRLLRGDNVMPQRIRWDNAKKWDEAAGSALSRYALRAGDTVVAMDRTWIAAGAKVAQVQAKDLPSLLVQRVARLRARDGLDQNYMYQLLSGHGFEHFVRSAKTETAIPHISPHQVRAFPILLPSISEQQEIAKILSTWDVAIDRTLALRGLAGTRYAELAERILAPSRGARRKLAELTVPIKVRNSGKGLDRDSVMGVSNLSGLVPMREHTIAADISRYQVLPPRAFAYNPMRINVGSIAMSQSESDVLVSPDYVLFRCNDGELRPEYLDHVLKTRWWLHNVNAGASGSVRSRTYYDDLAAISIVAPSVAEQDNITRVLTDLSKEVQLLQRKVDLLRTQKRGLMQKLLTGQVLVNVASNIEPGVQDDE